MMGDDAGHLSPSGVRIANDFRDNLIIDRYDPVFADMRMSKRKHLRSANSEDAITWNVFRTLRQIQPALWLPLLWARAFPGAGTPSDLAITVKLWESVRPPLGLLDGGDEGASEIDVIIEAPTWVWFIEAKYRSDISPGTTTRPSRDQILRNLDVGTYYAGVRPFYFSLLTLSREADSLGARKLALYANHDAVRAELAAHRPDGLRNLTSIGPLTWSDLAAVLHSVADTPGRDDERGYARRACAWMGSRQIGPAGFSRSG